MIALDCKRCSIALRAIPIVSARWSGQQQHEQHRYRSDQKRKYECAEKSHATLNAAKSCKEAKYDIDDNCDRCH